MTNWAVDGVNNFGSNLDISNATPEDVWPLGGDYVFPTQARIHDLVSDAAADASAGTGARTVLVEGLDADYNEISETITLNGLTPVPTTLEYLRINLLTVKTAGSGEENAGIITATAQTDATVTSVISIGINISTQCIFTVPADADLMITEFYIAIGRMVATSATCVLLLRPFGEVFQSGTTIAGNSTGTTDTLHPFNPNARCSAKSDIKLRALVGSNNAEIHAGFNARFSRPPLSN